jgi:hypothetical protein
MPVRKSSKLIRAGTLAVFLASSSPLLRGQTGQPSVAPRFALSARSIDSNQAVEGWPLILQGTFCHPQVYSRSVNVSPLLINSMNGSWSNTVHLVVTDSSGATQSWPIQLVTIPSGPIVLDAINVGRLFWVVAPSNTEAIAPGTYMVQGTLDTTASAGSSGWSGTTNSNIVSLQVAPPLATETSDQQERQYELLAEYDQLVGNDVQALNDINTLLAQQPNSVGGLAWKGTILEQTGQTAGALAAYDQAVATAFSINPDPRAEPPEALLTPQGRLRSKLLSQSGNRGTPAIAIQLLDMGTQAPGVVFFDLKISNVGSGIAANAVIQQFAFNTTAGTGQLTLNNVLTPLPPISVDYLAVNASTTVRIYVNVPSTVTAYSIAEMGEIADIFGTPTPFTETQAVTGSGPLLGDLNGDGSVGCDDLAIVKASFGKKVGQPGFDPRADVNGDGVVNVLDLSIVARQLPAGTTCP